MKLLQLLITPSPYGCEMCSYLPLWVGFHVLCPCSIRFLIPLISVLPFSVSFIFFSLDASLLVKWISSTCMHGKNNDQIKANAFLMIKVGHGFIHLWFYEWELLNCLLIIGIISITLKYARFHHFFSYTTSLYITAFGHNAPGCCGPEVYVPQLYFLVCPSQKPQKRGCGWDRKQVCDYIIS